MYGLLIAVATIATGGVGDTRWDLPCLSPAELVSDEMAKPPDERHEEMIVMRRPLRRRAAPMFHTKSRNLGPDRPQDEPGIRGSVMRQMGLVELEGAGDAACRMRFARAKNLSFRVKFDFDKPSVGIAYVTKY
jgi:hypothetical protein